MKTNIFYRRVTPYLYILPYGILFGIFILYPIGRALQVSFYKWGLLSPDKTFVGLKNFYEVLFLDECFWESLRATLYYVILSTPLLISLPLILAVMLRENIWGRNFFQTSIFLPLVISVSATGIIMRWIMDPEVGLLNYYLQAIGLPPQKWLQQGKWAMIPVALSTLWWQVGFNTIILTAAVRDVPSQFYEAASIDGAGRWKSFLYITLPSIKPALLLVLVLQIISSFNVFGQIYVITEGGPHNSTRVLVYYLYETAFHFFKMGKAAAIAWIMFGIVGISIYIPFKVLRSRF